MVLDEATSDQEPSPFSSESAPTSDIDPYASSSANPPYSSTRDLSYLKIEQPGSEPIYININNIPHPIFASSQSRDLYKAIGGSTQKTCEHASQLLKRPVTQEEAEAFAFSVGKITRVASYGAPVGGVLGTLYAYRKSGPDYRFPGWTAMKEGGRFSPDVFGPLRGSFARAAWQSARLTAYASIGVFLGQIFFASYGLSSGAASRVFDPRLKEYNDALKQNYQKDGAQQRQQQQIQGEAPKGNETFDMARQRRTVQRQQTPAQTQQQPVDDMSPTGGMFEDEAMRTNAGLMDDAQARSNNYRGSDEWKTDGQTFDAQASNPQQQSQQRNQSTPRPSTSSDQPSQKQSGSSWDRLRQNAMSGNKAQPTTSRAPPAPQKPSSGDDSFSFSQADEERQLARPEAQREFDARVEREREGKDFQDGRSGGRRW